MNPSSNDLAVSVRGLNKSYTIAHQAEKHSTFAEAMLDRVRHPFRRDKRETFEALKDVSFDISKGEVIGVIGRNGAGKSTLLKVLSRITEPTSGEIDLYGRVGSLLEVGTGFHPELTGRENVFLNGAILGMSRAEIRKQFDAIVEFAGVEQFLDTPVKRYSSGMYVRLAFAVAAHLESEILIVDEVLAVGDAEFQNKCLGKMHDVAKSGRTVFLVSHSMQAIASLCDRALFLKNGALLSCGDVPEAIAQYMAAPACPVDAITSRESAAKRRGTGELRVISIAPSKELFTCSEVKEISFSIEQCKAYRGKFDVFIIVTNEQGVRLLQCDSRLLGPSIAAGHRYEATFQIRSPWLKPGSYRVDIFVCGATAIDEFPAACTLHVAPSSPYPGAANPQASTHGLVVPDFSLRCMPHNVPASLPALVPCALHS